VDTDEEPGKGNIEKLPALNPAFEKGGTVTAGNASSINDGAAALVVMSEEKAKELGKKPLARIVAQAQAALAPEWFTMAPADAMKSCLEKAKLKASDIDLWEVNEAFSVVARQQPKSGNSRRQSERQRGSGGPGSSHRRQRREDPHDPPL
jgi:acetyl-CoA C-acetyltransferase